MSENYERIWKIVADIPVGSVLSYGEVARRAGLPRRARLVGQALGAAPKTLKLPWHRVILSSGRIAFSRGSAAYCKQAKLLRAEAVKIGDKGEVYAPTHTQTLDEVLWSPE